MRIEQQARRRTMSALAAHGVAALLLLAGVLQAAGLGAPTTLAPGTLEERPPEVELTPVFSWISPEKTEGFELVVMEIEGEDRAPWQEDESPATIRRSLPGSAHSWRPAPDELLRPGRSYAWMLRARQGESLGSWSLPRFFKIGQRSKDDPTLDSPMASDGWTTNGALAPEIAATQASSAVSVEGWPVLAVGPAPYRIPAAAFTAKDPYVLFQFAPADSSFLAAQPNNGFDCFYAPLFLPYGAKIWQYAMTYYDDHFSQPIHLELFQSNWSTGQATSLTSLGTAYEPANTDVRTINSTVGLNLSVLPGHSYQWKLCMWDHNHRLYAVQISFATN